MARRFGSIKPTRAGNYVGRYRIKGKDYYTPVERTRGEIEAHLRRTQRQIQNGEWQAPQPTQATKPAPSTTFQDWATTWISQAEKTGLSPNTARSYRSITRKHVNPRIGTMQLRDIRPDEIRQLKIEIDATNAPGTARNILLATSAILTAAVDAGLIEANPAKAVKGIYAKPARTLQPIALTSSQLNLLIDSADENMRAAFALAGWGALRYGEVAALQRKHINPAESTVTIERSVARETGGKLIIKPPKSRAGYRTITLPPHAMQIVQHHLDTYTPPGRDALVFHRPSGNNGFVSDRVLRKHLQDTCAKLGLPRLRFHDLRHTGLTLYGQAGATLADLMSRAGHADAKTVMIYQHSSLERDAELASRMG